LRGADSPRYQFRQEEMRADANRLRNVGWAVNETTFVGGHSLAPLSYFLQAAAWITSHPGW